MDRRRRDRDDADGGSGSRQRGGGGHRRLRAGQVFGEDHFVGAFGWFFFADRDEGVARVEILERDRRDFAQRRLHFRGRCVEGQRFGGAAAEAERERAAFAGHRHLLAWVVGD